MGKNMTKNIGTNKNFSGTLLKKFFIIRVYKPTRISGFEKLSGSIPFNMR